MTSEPYTNRLIHEKSPYLLQHAHNPVDWYPWGQEAFDAARTQDKPIFLSIGYATCHWCHVMERESFENPEIATLMNEVFINIKVDREELPEIDSIYMDFAQALMSSAGGWPLNVILTADLKPFFAVTYLPPNTHRGLMGLPQFVEHIKQLWQSEEKAELVEQADKLVEMFAKASPSAGEEMPDENLLLSSVEHLFEIADPLYGGIKGEPKFPLGYQLDFLLEFARSSGDSRALFYAELTLDRMYQGGIYDHLGGGFSRYSVDERWMIPHFEKMGYDNAILANTYLKAWTYTKKPHYKKIAEEILNYLLRDMAHPDGGFYSAEDADSEGHEGRFYTWTPAEVREVLPQADADLFCAFFDINLPGNFDGRSVLHIEVPLEEFAQQRNLAKEELAQKLETGKAALLKKRQERPRPFKDDKILTSWNGLMIHVLIKAGAAFKNDRFSSAAVKTAEFLRKNLWNGTELLRRWREGEARFSGGLDDYAFLIHGLLSLFEENAGTAWLEWALQLQKILERDFKAEKGAFFQTRRVEEILIRKCEFYDGAEPSGNGMHSENLLRLFQLSYEEKYLEQAEEIFKAAKVYIETYSPGACYHLMALQRYFDAKAPTVVVALDEANHLEPQIKEELASHFRPHREVVWKRKEERADQLLPIHADKVPIDGQTALYICRQDLCEEPLIQWGEMVKAIENL